MFETHQYSLYEKVGVLALQLCNGSLIQSSANDNKGSRPLPLPEEEWILAGVPRTRYIYVPRSRTLSLGKYMQQ